MIDDDDDDEEHTTFEANPWGAQQRVMPRRGFRAAATGVILEPLPGLPPRNPALRPRKKKFVAQTPKTEALDVSDVEIVEFTPVRRAAPPPVCEDEWHADASDDYDRVAPSDEFVRIPPSEQFVRIATAWPTKPVSIIDRACRYALPVAGLFVLAVLSLAYMQPDKAAHAATAATATATTATATAKAEPVRMPATTSAITATPIEPTVTVTPIVPELPKPEPTFLPGAKREAKPAPKQPSRKRLVAVDTSTPLGNLRVKKF